MPPLRRVCAWVVAPIVAYVLATSDGRRACAEPQDLPVLVRQAAARVMPAVVYVRVIATRTSRGKSEEVVRGGSGVLVGAQGELLTNWHVVDKAREIRCLLNDGRAFGARLVGSDADTDLAVVQLDVPQGTPPFPVAALGDSDRLSAGDFVMALGAPFGMGRSVSLGIVACPRRFLAGNSEYSHWIQTDASVNPGNSGGPLIDAAGAVVGITTRAVRAGGDIGFAIPASTLQVLVPRLREHGEAQWSWTGIQLGPLRSFETNTYASGTTGVMVRAVEPESPAAQAGVQPGDRLLTLDGRAVSAVHVEEVPALQRQLGLLPLERAAQLTLQRADRTVAVPITPRRKGAVRGEDLALKGWDFVARAITRFERPDLHRWRSDGAYVHAVGYPGNAARAGLRRGDILLRVGETDVRTLAELGTAQAAALEARRDERSVLLVVLRGGLEHQLVLDWSRDHERE